MQLVAAVPAAQLETSMDDAVANLRAAGRDAIAHVGFGFGLIRINTSLAAAGWGPPRLTTTAWENAAVGGVSTETTGDVSWIPASAGRADERALAAASPMNGAAAQDGRSSSRPIRTTRTSVCRP